MAQCNDRSMTNKVSKDPSHTALPQPWPASRRRAGRACAHKKGQPGLPFQCCRMNGVFTADYLPRALTQSAQIP